MDIFKICQGFLCPTCGYSLLRMSIDPNTAPKAFHHGNEFTFCCEECVKPFLEVPEPRLAEIKEMIICPICLCEKRKCHTICITHQGEIVYLCRCPNCITEFKSFPEPYIERMKGKEFKDYKMTLHSGASCPGEVNYIRPSK
jgi:YHS domain-containing protein